MRGPLATMLKVDTMKKALIISFIICFHFLNIQSKDKIPYQYVEQAPLFNGSRNILDFMIYVNKKTKIPKNDSIKMLNGVNLITVEFVVDSLGQIKDIELIKGVNKDLDNAVLTAIQGSPKWTPGMDNGKPVDVSYEIPFIFHFPNKETRKKGKKVKIE